MSQSEELSAFLATGVYRLSNCNAVFVDPVRILNHSYSRYRLSPSVYYSRFFQSKRQESTAAPITASRKRKRVTKSSKTKTLNQAEKLADLRHQEVRPLLVKTHESFTRNAELLSALCDLRNDAQEQEVKLPGVEQSLVELGTVWQAPMFEIALSFHSNDAQNQMAGGEATSSSSIETRVLPVFDNIVANEMEEEVEAEFLDRRYIIPRESSFLMSDMAHISKLVPENSDQGFHLIIIDPPWENGSARQKSMYPTLPNKYFLSIPIKQLAHEEGALVALWVTNREKLRNFVEKELFAKWEVKHVATFHWMKVKADGSLISELDLVHHRPYECLLLGYYHGEISDSARQIPFKAIQDNQVIISVPGDYSRKPPLKELLKDNVPGLKPARCLELFAREMVAGCTSWGNEPLRFQDSRYLLKKTGNL